MAVDQARILDQLRSQKAFFKYDYGNATLDPWLTSELARLLAKAGLNDIRDIAFFDAPVSYVGEEAVESMQLQYFYDAETGNIIQNIGGRDFDPKLPVDVIASTSNDDFIFRFHCKFAGSVPYFVVEVLPKPKSGGSWLKQLATGIAPILPVVMIAANFFAPGFSGVLGNAILGPLGVTSTALATAVGNIAISTVASGGDVEGAMKNAFLGSLGANIGAAVGGGLQNVVDSDVLAKAAAAATSAAIQGGDPKQAVLGTLIPAGVQTVSDVFDFFSDPSTDVSVTPSVDVPQGNIMDPINASTGVDFGNISLDPSNNYPFATGDYTFDMGNGNDGYPVDLPTPDVPVYTDTPNIVVSGNGQTSSASDWVNSLSQVALAAIKISAAYQAAGKPSIQVSGQQVGGRTVVANSNGTVTVNGRVAVPPKGVPYITADGSVVMNNGDGTYTKVSSSGVSATNPYTSASVQNGLFSSVNPMVVVGGGLLLLLALTR